MSKPYIILFLFFITLGAFAQDYKFDHLTANDGLGDNFVRRIFEDSYGFIWIGTKDGLSKYDGYDIKTYKKQKNNSNSLPSGYIGAITEDEFGNMWIGTGNGLVKYIREYDSFKIFSFNTTYENSIYQIVIDSTYLWIATFEGLCKFNIITEETEWVISSESKQLQYDKYRITRMIKGEGDYLWIGYSDLNGLLRFNTKTYAHKQYFPIGDEGNGLVDNSISALYELNDSIILVGCRDIGAFAFNVRTEIFSKIKIKNNLSTAGLSMPWDFYEDSNKRIWIGTINGGLFEFDKSLSTYNNYIPYESNTDGVNSMSISTILEDKHGNLWFGTHGGGVNILYHRKNLFKHFKKTTHSSSISHNFVSCFFESSPGKIWIGTDGGGLNLFDSKQQGFKNFTIKDGLSSNAILSITSYSKDELLLSTWDGGIIIFNTKTYKSKIIKHQKNVTNSINYKNAKYAFRKGDSLYIVTHGRGLNIYDIKNDIYYNSDTDSAHANLAIPESANKAIFDKKGSLWIASTVGLFKYVNGIMDEYLPDSSGISISGSYVTDIFIDSKDRMWVATLSGLNMYVEDKDLFVTSELHEELNSAIMSITEDNYGYLWMGTNAGLIKYQPETDEVIVYNESDGLQGNQFYERSAYIDSKGLLYFGGMNGYNMFHPKKLEIDKIEPIICFTDFKIFYKSQFPSAKKSVLEKHINFTDEIVLEHSQKVISFDFVAIQKLSSSKNKYAYILEGFDKSWYTVGATRTATYTNLLPGNYTFKVRACNADNTWVKHSKDIKVRVLPPWWLAWWFIVLLIAFVLGVIVLVFYIRTRTIKRTNRTLELTVKARTAELVENKEELLINNEKLAESLSTKDRFFSIIAHDLKNPMNALIGFSELLLHRWDTFSDEKKHLFISQIHASSNHLFSLLTNLLEWSRAQTGKIEVEKGKYALKKLIDENITVLSTQAQGKEINFFCEKEINDDVFVFIDYNMIDTVVRNIISNAIKFTPRQGSVIININDRDAQMVEIIIKDSGVGMNANKINHLFRVDKNVSTPGTEDEKGTGLGLIVCNEFIALNGGTITVESEEGKGSKFIICLPKAK